MEGCHPTSGERPEMNPRNGKKKRAQERSDRHHCGRPGGRACPGCACPLPWGLSAAAVAPGAWGALPAVHRGSVNILPPRCSPFTVHELQDVLFVPANCPQLPVAGRGGGADPLQRPPWWQPRLLSPTVPVTCSGAHTPRLSRIPAGPGADGHSAAGTGSHPSAPWMGSPQPASTQRAGISQPCQGPGASSPRRTCVTNALGSVRTSQALLIMKTGV